jgi:hypothetical protein
MKRSEIINDIIRVRNYKSYLEIGVRDTPDNFKRIKISKRTGVDPEPRKLLLDKNVDTFHKLTSDEFFKQNKQKFDIIFIDGLHTDEQVTKDIENSLKALNEDGCVLLHDCNPKTEFHQRPYEQYQLPNGTKPSWNGTVWKAFVRYRNNPEYDQFCVGADQGVGFIQKGSQLPLNIKEEDLVWKNFSKNRNEWLNLITKETFKSWVNE